MKNWKSLFVKSAQEVEVSKNLSSNNSGSYNFPINNTSDFNSTAIGVDEKVMNEVIAVYEKGIDSINMPGYDFYEFYKAISSISQPGEQAYIMAYQMAKSMDNTLSAGKLIQDADFYISKINEVHQEYNNQGQSRINAIEAKKNDEKNNLMQEIEKGSQQLSSLRNQLQALEIEISQKRTKLSSLESVYQPQEATIRQKLLANDSAKHLSIMKLMTVKENIKKNIK
jgi:hypothetical protein